MVKTLKITTITSNDLGISWGPAVHFLELWNGMPRENVSIFGHAPSWTRKEPIILPKFDLRIWPVPNMPWIRQIIWDMIASIIIIKSRSDFVYIRLCSFHVFTYLALRLRKSRLALEMNGVAAADHASSKSASIKASISQWCERILIQRADVTFSVTQEIKDLCEKRNPLARHFYIPNGVGTQFFDIASCCRPGKLSIIYVGTFTPWDGSEKICDIAKRHPDIRFLMVGDGGQRKEIEKLAPANMIFVGWVNYRDLPAFYGQADGAIVLYERARHSVVGISSLKIREYLAAGLPVYTTFMNQHFFIENRGFGILADTTDVSSRFCEYLAALPEMRRKLEADKDILYRETSWRAASQKTLACLLASSER